MSKQDWEDLIPLAADAQTKDAAILRLKRHHAAGLIMETNNGITVHRACSKCNNAPISRPCRVWKIPGKRNGSCARCQRVGVMAQCNARRHPSDNSEEDSGANRDSEDAAMHDMVDTAPSKDGKETQQIESILPEIIDLVTAAVLVRVGVDIETLNELNSNIEPKVGAIIIPHIDDRIDALLQEAAIERMRAHIAAECSAENEKKSAQAREEIAKLEARVDEKFAKLELKVDSLVSLLASRR